MKKINAIAWLITMLMTLVANPAVAASGTNYEVEVGKTLRLDISNFGVECMANGSSYTWEITQAYVGDDTNYNDYLTFTSKSKNYAIVKGVKAGKLVGIQYTGYYYYNGTRKEFYDAFYVRVVASGTPSTGPASLEVFPTPQTMKVGETKWVYVNQTRAIGGTYFYSEDESIATVTHGELASPNSYTTAAQITAKKAGKVNIVAKNVNGLTDVCEVTVTAQPVTSVSIPSSLSLEVGGTYTLTPSIYPSNAETSFTWTSDNCNVATVSQSGKVTAKSAGSANIKITTENGKFSTCKVTVNAPKTNEYAVRYYIYDNGTVKYNNTLLTGYDSFNVTEGSDVALTIIPDDGYELDWIWIDYEDAKDQLVNNVLTIRNIRKDMSLTVSFEKKEDPVVVVPVYLNCNVGEGGYITHGNTTIMGENKIGVSEGDDITIKIVTNEGYHIDAVKLDGTNVKSQLVGNELKIRNMTADKNLLVTFEADKQDPNVPVVTTENTMTLSNVTANTRTTVAFPIGLNNVDEITALQMDLYLPSGITLATDEDGDVRIETTDRVSNKHTVDCSKMADGSYRIICYSTKNNTFTGNGGELFSLLLIVSSELVDGDYEITATNIELSDKTGTAYSGQDVKGVVTVKSYMLGDVDGNGQHSINDVVCIINYVLNRPNTTFIEAAADMDGNGEISMNDAVLLISKYILGTSSNVRKATRSAVVNNEQNYMCIDDVTMQPGEVKTIEVMMLNERDDIRGMQCDITLPEGISFLYDEDNEDYVTASSRIPKKLALSSEMQNENTLRVAGVCTGSSSIYGNTGSVFTFKVKADENIMAGMYEIQLSNVELSYGEAIGVADRSSALEILNETDGISTLFLNRESKTDVYDLSGRHVDGTKTKKGVFIINGKKVLINK